MIRGADLSHADICEISTELEAEENLDPQPPATFITTGAADCGGSCPRQIDTRRRLSCHISGIWPGRDVGAEQWPWQRYGPLAGLALRCCSRSAGPDAPVAEIAM